MKQFRFDIGQSVQIEASGEAGTVTGRAEYEHSEDQYYLRYRAADGRAVQSWWADSALAS